jgi:hypothetical protein
MAGWTCMPTRHDALTIVTITAQDTNNRTNTLMAFPFVMVTVLSESRPSNSSQQTGHCSLETMQGAAQPSSVAVRLSASVALIDLLRR